jgi:hypothetical protein
MLTGCSLPCVREAGSLHGGCRWRLILSCPVVALAAANWHRAVRDEKSDKNVPSSAGDGNSGYRGYQDAVLQLIEELEVSEAEASMETHSTVRAPSVSVHSGYILVDPLRV